LLWVSVTGESMVLRILVVAFTALFFLEGCKREIANRNLEQVRLNMSPKEVETILGEPDRMEKKEEDGETDKKPTNLLTYYYEQNNQTIVLRFQNGHLVKEPDRLTQLDHGNPN
jgi:hypothetical protein